MDGLWLLLESGLWVGVVVMAGWTAGRAIRAYERRTDAWREEDE